jgi:uncharacterized protein (TIGR03086 family)
MAGSDPRTLLFGSFDQAARLVRGVSVEQLELPTPCSEFDVTALLTHIVGVGRRIAALGRGEDQTGALPVPQDVARSGWGDAFDDAHQEALAAWADEDVLALTMHVPFGTFDGTTIAGVYLMELTTHGWDLARATDQVSELEDKLAEAALTIAHMALPPEPRGGFIPFKAVAETPLDASPYDRLAAYLGRDIA